MNKEHVEWIEAIVVMAIILVVAIGTYYMSKGLECI